MSRSCTIKNSTKPIKKLIKKNLRIAVNKDIVPSQVDKLNPSQIKYLNYHLTFARYHAVTFTSLPHLADFFGVNERTIRRWNDRLEELGLIFITRRRFSRTKNYPNVYKTNPAFRNPEVRWKVGYKLKSLMGLSLAFLFSTAVGNRANPYYSRNVQVLKEETYIYIKHSLRCNLSVDYDSILPKKEGYVMVRRESESPLTRSKQKLIQFLNPTPRARIETELYSEKALSFCTAEIKGKLVGGKEIHEPFTYLFKLCEEYSRANKCVIERDNVERLKKVYTPSGSWSNSPVDIKQLKKEAPRKKFTMNSYKRPFKKNLEQDKPILSSTQLLEQAKKATTQREDAMLDCREQMAIAVAKNTNSDGSYLNPFMAILAQGVTENNQ